MPLTPDQLAARAKGIGGSDAGAIVGVSPWASAFDVFARLRPDVIPCEGMRVESEAAYWGTALEAPIAERYAKLEHAAGSRVELAEVTTTLRHPGREWMLAHPDRLISGGGKPPGVLEVKTAGIRQAHRWGEEDSGEIPEEYRCQVAHYMAVTDLPRADVAVLLGGQELRVYRLVRDPELEELLIEALEEFWTRHVQAGIPPPIGESPRAAEWIGRLHPRNTTGMRQATAADIVLAKEYSRAREVAKDADAAKEAARVPLCAAIGDAEGIWWGDDPRKPSKATWKCNREGARTDWEALAKSLNPPDDLVARYTHATVGARVLRVAAKE